MKNKILIFISLIFISIGILFFIITKFMFYEFNKPIENDKETFAIITSIDEDVYLSFTDDNGEIYNVKSNYKSSDMKIGDRIKVHYNSKNPLIMKVDIDEFDKIFSLVFYGTSIFMISIGLIILIIALKVSTNRRKLLNSGLMLNATIISVNYNQYININGKHPYTIIASFIYNGETYETKSENLWFDAKNIIDNYNIRELPVYIDTNNPKLNILDTSIIKDKLGN